LWESALEVSVFLNLSVKQISRQRCDSRQSAENAE